MPIYYQKAFVFVLSTAGLLTFFTSDASYNIGRLLTISIVVLIVAYYITKDKNEKTKAIYFFIASLIPLVTITQTITSENSQRASLESINQSLSTHRQLLTETEKGAPSEIKAKDLIDPSQIKPATNNQDLLKEVSKLVEIATAKTKKNYDEQNKILEKANFGETLSPKSLKNINGVIRLTESIKIYEDYLNVLEIENKRFNSEYKNAVMILAKNYSQFLDGFNTSFNDSVMQQEKMMRTQRAAIVEFKTIARVVKAGYENNQIKYDPVRNHLIMLNDDHLQQYNNASERLELLAKEEDRILRESEKKLESAQNNMNRQLKK
jgi:hypothetical protein